MMNKKFKSWLGWFFGIFGVLIIGLAAMIMPAYLPFAWGITYLVVAIVAYVAIISWICSRKSIF